MFSSRSISQPRALIAILVAVTILLLSTIPPSSAAKPTPSSNTYTGHIVNQEANKVIEVQCNASKTESTTEYVLVNEEFKWSFKADENTSWRCLIAFNNFHKEFVAFGRGAERSPLLDAHNNFYWMAESDALFVKNPYNGVETIAYWWDKGGANGPVSLNH